MSTSCIEASVYTSGVILGTYNSLAECTDNCNCFVFSACFTFEVPEPWCPPGCYLDFNEFAPSNCVCCDGTIECPSFCANDGDCCANDEDCGDKICCPYAESGGSICRTPVDGWVSLGYNSLQECYDNDPGAPATCDAPACPVDD
jgi:hypothetical protein